MSTQTRVNGTTNAGLVSMTILDCPNCGVIFGITADYENRRREDHVGFRCPNGHTMSYSGDTEADRLRKELAQTKRRAESAQARSTHLSDQLETSERRRAAAKGQLTKAKNRIAKGVCPCCNRHFADLARHMAGQHPTYAGEPS